MVCNCRFSGWDSVKTSSPPSTLCLIFHQHSAGEKKDPYAFGWRERYKVTVGVAEALDYIHNSCTQPVIHKDVKSSNILLSEDFEPQVPAIAHLNFFLAISFVIFCSFIHVLFNLSVVRFWSC